MLARQAQTPPGHSVNYSVIITDPVPVLRNPPNPDLSAQVLSTAIRDKDSYYLLAVMSPAA
jgi:hypothetical protein